MAQTMLRDLPDHLLSEGTSWFTAREAADAAGVPLAHVYPGLKRLADRGQIFSPARGFYVPIPPEFRMWGSVPATHFVDAMMRHLDRRYYVGLLSAAELHGAAHQRPQVFQVMVERPLADRRNGRTRLSFHVRSRLAEVPTEQLTTPTGYLVVSTPEATVLDLASRPAEGAGSTTWPPWSWSWPRKARSTSPPSWPLQTRRRSRRCVGSGGCWSGSPPST
ncbi:MAG: hypothetical protein M5U19_11620 [Microthrixaceae bacterium]|nr:hypothetical protein [Microthrixaceae bacterium]